MDVFQRKASRLDNMYALKNRGLGINAGYNKRYQGALEF